MPFKRTLLFLILLTFISCSNNETFNNIQRAKKAEYSNPPKLSLFDNVEKIRKMIISSSDLFTTDWRLSKFVDGSEKWNCRTAIQQFGKISENGFQNDINYVLLGKEKSSINELKIVLNIKNDKDVENARQILLLLTNQLLLKLDILNTKGLTKSISYGEEFFFENDSSYIYLFQERKKEINNTIHPDKETDKQITYTSWILSIKSK